VTSPFDEREKIRKMINDLLPGDKKLRLRESIMRVNDAIGQFPHLGSSIMTAIASAARYRKGPPARPEAKDGQGQFLPNDFDEWTNYMYAEIHDALSWLLRLERDILEMGDELRHLIMARELIRRAAEEARSEKEYAARDNVRYAQHLLELGGETSGEPGPTGGDSGGGGEGGGGQGGSLGPRGADPPAGEAPELHAAGREEVEGPAAKARRILGE
jgi:hypothetical protein